MLDLEMGSRGREERTEEKRARQIVADMSRYKLKQNLRQMRKECEEGKKQQ
jgi:hypothetical protein